MAYYVGMYSTYIRMYVCLFAVFNEALSCRKRLTFSYHLTAAHTPLPPMLFLSELQRIERGDVVEAHATRC